MDGHGVFIEQLEVRNEEGKLVVSVESEGGTDQRMVPNVSSRQVEVGTYIVICTPLQLKTVSCRISGGESGSRDNA